MGIAALVEPPRLFYRARDADTYAAADFTDRLAAMPEPQPPRFAQIESVETAFYGERLRQSPWTTRDIVQTGDRTQRVHGFYTV